MNNELTAALATIEKCREIVGCPDGVDLQDWVEQLAAENVGLKALIPENWQMHDVLHQLIVARPGGVYFNKWEKLIAEVLNATPATNRIVAEVEARGVEKLAMRRRAAAKVALDEFNDVKNHAELESEAWRAEMFAAELREGAANE
ncbi:hypothetical protein [Klebsiella spallanzanii]|uniref:Uncharacterized protein n=1 Tax=Klebsiella spallanzanii TaxID=2587528 RepID=A0A564JAS4_9ENTR|nr:hypothetical protein [Klebsiella spallanzanii]VUS54124.1 hypothetical protein SB6408_04572 [Klebsiella spallanzanii]